MPNAYNIEGKALTPAQLSAGALVLIGPNKFTGQGRFMGDIFEVVATNTQGCVVKPTGLVDAPDNPNAKYLLWFFCFDFFPAENLAKQIKFEASCSKQQSFVK